MILTDLLALIRFDKPIGTLLLWYPTAWALWLTNHGHPPLRLIGLLLLGTFLMRSAGCVFNDITDRQIDRHVKRTVTRPITSGKVSLITAFTVLISLLCAACVILIQLPRECFMYALFALLITGLYPFGKRWLDAPQLILGFAFSMGIPIAYLANHIPLDSNTGLLCLINFFWTLGYDTAYAMNDREDDRRIGVKSMALLLGQHANTAIRVLSIISHSLWLILAACNHLSLEFYALWSVAGIVLIYQLTQLSTQTQFYSNGVYGLILWLALIH
jgi:4-hydroxybenzoate polyprenyltransferase